MGNQVFDHELTGSYQAESFIAYIRGGFRTEDGDFISGRGTYRGFFP